MFSSGLTNGMAEGVVDGQGTPYRPHASGPVCAGGTAAGAVVVDDKEDEAEEGVRGPPRFLCLSLTFLRCWDGCGDGTGGFCGAVGGSWGSCGVVRGSGEMGSIPRGQGLYISVLTVSGVRVRSNTASGVHRGSHHLNW